MRSTQKTPEIPESERMFRYWVEIKNLETGEIRSLDLKAFRKVHFPTKKNQRVPPNEDFLQIVDGSAKIEAADFDGIRSQLRELYPDYLFIRTLFVQRDLEAERRHAQLIDTFREILVGVVIDEIRAKQFSASSKSSKRTGG